MTPTRIKYYPRYDYHLLGYMPHAVGLAFSNPDIMYRIKSRFSSDFQAIVIRNIIMGKVNGR